MKQVRIVKAQGTEQPDSRRFACEWMEASMANRWFLKNRLAEALQAHGQDAYRIEVQDKPVELAHALA